MPDIADLLPQTNVREWRGWSGRRYRADVLAIMEAAERGAHDAVGLAVQRGDDGIGRQVVRATLRITPDWIARAKAQGADEVHAIALPAGEADRVLDDLRRPR